MIKYKFLILIGLLSVSFASCSSVKEAFDPQRKNGSEEFLVEKKLPLSMPPDFDKLPVPQNNKEVTQNQNEDIELLITKTNKEKDRVINSESLNKDFEILILEKIKNN
jgi:hypothetical protein